MIVAVRFTIANFKKANSFNKLCFDVNKTQQGKTLDKILISKTEK